MVQIHGILTRQSSATWTRFGEGWFEENHPQIGTVSAKYFALPLPRIEALRNQERSRALVREVLDLAAHCEELTGVFPSISFVCHSNGGVLALQVARKLIAQGIPIRAMVLIAPALRTGPASREIAAWLDCGMLDYALLVRPTRDLLIRAMGANWKTRLFSWPWGSLGSDGWDVEAIGDVFPNIPETIDLPDMGHSGPVSPTHREWLYESVIAPALGLAAWGELQPKGEGAFS